VICFTDYGVIAEKPSVGYYLPETFRAPCRKNYELDRNLTGNTLKGLDVFYHRTKFGEDHTSRSGCSCENVENIKNFHFLLKIRLDTP